MLRTAIWLIPFVLVAVLTGPVLAQQTSIENTPHNLNNADVWGVQIPQSQICLPCHIPHHAQPSTGGDGKVLWNHEVTGATFQMYSPFWQDRPPGDTPRDQDPQPIGPSKLCLSCHDGVTAIDSYGGNDGYFNNVKIPSWRPTNIGIDLRDDHPIGIAYPDWNVNPGYKNPSTFDGVRLVTVEGKPNRVECTSCHEPHNNGLGKFLRAPIAGSNLCLQCHDI